MKKIVLKTTVVAFCISVSLLIGCKKEVPACKQETCNSSNSDNFRSINFFDVNTSSTYYNQVVSNFKFTQTTTTYTIPNECSTCPLTSYSVKLQIANTTNKTIHFDYNVSFALNLASWNYQGIVTISPYGTTDIGQINSNPASISLGQITIQSASITYQ